MTTTPAPETKLTAATFDPLSSYPSMMRIGHRYENTLGQRLAAGGFKGPQDVAVGPGNWLYVVNRYSEAGVALAR